MKHANAGISGIVAALLAVSSLIECAVAQDGPGATSAVDRVEYVSDRPYQETIQQLQWTLGGFGITVVYATDFQEVLKKMKVQTGHAAIFEVMRRDWAKTLIEEDRSLPAILPLRIYVFEDPSGKTRLSYDRPSRMLDPHPSEKVRAFGHLLDEKMRSVMRQAATKR